MLSLVMMLLKGEAGGDALNSHGNYIVDHGKTWKNYGIVILNFCGNPENNYLVYTFQAHGSKGVMSMIANSKVDQLISAGKGNTQFHQTLSSRLV